MFSVLAVAFAQFAAVTQLEVPQATAPGDSSPPIQHAATIQPSADYSTDPIPTAAQITAQLSGKVISPAPEGSIKELIYSEYFAVDGSWERQVIGGAVQKFPGEWTASSGKVCVRRPPPAKMLQYCRTVSSIVSPNLMLMSTPPDLPGPSATNLYRVFEAKER